MYVHYLYQSANENFSVAQFKIGKILVEGEVTEKNVEQGIYYLNKAEKIILNCSDKACIDCRLFYISMITLYALKIAVIMDTFFFRLDFAQG